MKDTYKLAGRHIWGQIKVTYMYKLEYATMHNNIEGGTFYKRDAHI